MLTLRSMNPGFDSPHALTTQVSLTSQRFQKSARVAELATESVRRIVTVVFSVWGQMFGRAHLGRIRGCAQKICGLAVIVLFLGITSRHCPERVAQILAARSITAY